MKKNLLNVLIAVILFLIPNLNFGQVPNLGTTSNFALFTKTGALNNVGISNITGDIGSFDTSPLGFPGLGSVIGTIYAVTDPALTQASTDVIAAYGSFGIGGVILATPFENQTLSPGEYYTIGAAALNGNLTLDGGGNANAIFIIKVNGALSIGTISSNVILTGSASLCNVYWQVNGEFTLGNNSIFRGTLVSNGAISLSGSSTIFGRALTTAGAINTTSITVTIPIGCGNVGTPVFTIGATSSRYQGSGSVTYTATAENTTGITYSLDATTAAFSGNSIVSSTGEVTYAAGWSGITTITATAAGTNGPTTATHTVTVCPTTVPTISAGSATTFCTGGNVILSGNSGGVWNTGAVTPTLTVSTAGDYFVTYTNSCGSLTSNHIIVTINSLPTASVITASGGITFCEGGNVILSGNVGGTWSTGAVTPSITVSTAGDYFVTNTNGCGNITSNHIIVTITQPPAAPYISANGTTTFCDGSNVTLSGNIGGIWSTGETTLTLTVTTAGDYYVTNTNSCGSTTSNHIVVTVLPLATASIITANRETTICQGENIILSGNVDGIWNTGVTTPTLTITASGSYFVTNTNVCGSVTSNHIVVTVTPQAIPSVIIAEGSTTFCQGLSVILSGNVNGIWSNGATTPTIMVTTAGDYFVTNTTGCESVTSNHIIVTINPLATASIITAEGATTFCLGESVVLLGNSSGIWNDGTTNPNLTVNTSGDYFVTNTNGCGNVTSNHILVTVNPLPLAVVGIDATICNGNSITIGDISVSGHSYLWIPSVGLSSDVIANPIANPNITTTYQLTETIIATGCENSNSVTVTVISVPIAAIISAEGATTFCANENVVLTGNIDGTWSNGSTNASITITTSGDYFVTNTNTCGSVTSNHIIVTVNEIPEAITGSDRSICLGNFMTIGSNPILGHTYLWSPITGLNTSTISNPVTSPNITTVYTVIETITATGCQNSNSITISISTNPSFSLEPSNQTICSGGSAIFTVAVTGTGLTYQWRNGVVNLSDGGNISGATTATLTINPVSITDAALNYNVVVTGACLLKTTSMNVSLSINTAPLITIEPVNQTVCAIGNSANFWVDAIGTGLTYQWRKGSVNLTDGGNISGANSAMLTINPVEITDVATNYNVVVSGTCAPASISLEASLSICTTTAIISSKDNKSVVNFFPNPFKTSINMFINDFSEHNSCEIRVYNILGELVFNTIVTKQLTTIETGNLPSGTYIYKVIDNNKTIQTGKLITQK